MSGDLLSSLLLTSSVMSTIMSSANPPEPPKINVETSQVQLQQDHNNKYDNNIADKLLGSSNKTEKILESQETITGVDVSSHQHKHAFDLDTIYKTQDFSFVKATEGVNYINPHFREDVINTINNKKPLGFYHYARPTSDTDNARKQARLFVKVTGMDQGVKGFDPVLDIEEDEGLKPNEIINWVEAFVDEIKDLTNRDTIIYTYPNFWRNNMNNTTKFSDLPLWIADYNGKAAPSSLPGGWNDWTFWQYTSEEVIEGSEKPLDANIFNGSEEDLKKMYK